MVKTLKSDTFVLVVGTVTPVHVIVKGAPATLEPVFVNVATLEEPAVVSVPAPAQEEVPPTTKPVGYVSVIKSLVAIAEPVVNFQTNVELAVPTLLTTFGVTVIAVIAAFALTAMKAMTSANFIILE